MQSTNFWDWSAGIAVHDNCTTFHNSSVISWFCLLNSICYVSPQVFNMIKVRRLCWPLHYFDYVCLEPGLCLFAIVFVAVLLKLPFQGPFLFSKLATWLLAVFWCPQTDPWSLVFDKKDHHHSVRNIPIPWRLHHHASLSSLCTSDLHIDIVIDKSISDQKKKLYRIVKETIDMHIFLF